MKALRFVGSCALLAAAIALACWTGVVLFAVRADRGQR